MNIKQLVVKDYLESLTEKDELNRIFPLLLESMGFEILSKPTEYLGLQEYGKDIVAVGIDEDKVKKRFYFELKGGADRNITTRNFYGKDGIQESITEATYTPFVSAYPKFQELPLKVVIVHNGVIEGGLQKTFENFLVKISKPVDNTVFERWDIARLTAMFSENLFGAYLLTDSSTTKLFNRVLVNLDTSDGVSRDFIKLIDSLFEKIEWKGYKTKIPRKWQLLFESLKLISFIIYTESKEYNNLDIAKRYLTHLVLRYWYWVLKNNLENNKKVLKHFNQVMLFFYEVLQQYFDRTLSIVQTKDGLYAENGGMSEQVGYTQRTFDYLAYLLILINMEKACFPDYDLLDARTGVYNVVQHNSVSKRPLLDIHSLVIVNTIELFIQTDDVDAAKAYLKSILATIKYRKDKSGMLPDANNSIQNVIKYTVTGTKPVYYSDSTSPLLAVLLEYIALFGLEEEYNQLRIFVKKHDITLGLFIPHHSKNSVSENLIEDKENDLEEQLFSKPLRDGYQVDTRLTKNLIDELPFEEFKEKIKKRKDEFIYEYRTDKAGYAFLKDLAHFYFHTPYFPDKWRNVTDGLLKSQG
ncbi:hypothetical protein OQ279_11620 [Salinimicrobium sp. MT39]|uniref:Uncharacterized protein n=1 Tax=Salinimicrobium profundisediminis TaxID=2994553 RepID=A0A9X3D022_9FLAO|nr:hypothetical protein [Salinimicrobium profundisediminis]MCX2838794.1 hypothetical protein [Salinimicrobium profundisediminis]